MCPITFLRKGKRSSIMKVLYDVDECLSQVSYQRNKVVRFPTQEWKQHCRLY